MFGKEHTDSTKEKIRQKAAGRKRTPEDIQRQIERTTKPVICTVTGERFDSPKAAAERYGLHHSTITAACRQPGKKAGRNETGEYLRWSYLVE